MNKKKSAIILTVFLIFSCAINVSTNAQDAREAIAYMNEIGKQYEDITKEMWDYTSSVAHSRSARKVEKNRIVLLKTIDKARNKIKSMPAFNGDKSLRDSIAALLKLNFDVLNHDYAKIIDMEEVAEQSYDLMEAYLLAQEKANEKLEHASERMENQYNAFAEKNNVTLVDNPDKTSLKLKKSSEALKYYNQVYLVFFKAYKQELYLFDALSKNDINAIEQNRNALSSISMEGIEKLSEINNFNGDNSINSSCKRTLTFFQDEADTKIPILADFIITKKEYDEMVTLFESKDRMQISNDEVKKYNKAVEDYNKGVNKYNSTNKALDTKRNSSYDSWNNSVASFMNRHIPKK